MRYTVPKEPKVGDTRIVHGFLFFSKCLLNKFNGCPKEEVRWLEKAYWKEEYKYVEVFEPDVDYLECTREVLMWVPTEWANV